MSFLDSLLGGKKPTRRAATGEELDLVRQGEAIYNSGARAQLTGLQGLAIRAAAQGRPGERARALGRDSADVAMATRGAPANSNAAFDRAMTRGRGLSRLARHTSGEFDNTLLRERLGMIQGGRQRQGVGLGALTDLAQMKDRIASGQTALDEQSSSLRSNLFGFATGVGVGFIPDIRGAIGRRRDARVGGEAGTGAGSAEINPYFGGLS